MKKRHDAARAIQRTARGFIQRQKFKQKMRKHLRRSRQRELAAVQAQSIIRGFLVRKEMRDELVARRELREQASVNISRVCMGWIARIETAKRKNRKAAALAIETQFRGHNVRMHPAQPPTPEPEPEVEVAVRRRR